MALTSALIELLSEIERGSGRGAEVVVRMPADQLMLTSFAIERSLGGATLYGGSERSSGFKFMGIRFEAA